MHASTVDFTSLRTCVFRAKFSGKIFLWVELYGNCTAWNTHGVRKLRALCVSVIFPEHSLHENPWNTHVRSEVKSTVYCLGCGVILTMYMYLESLTELCVHTHTHTHTRTHTHTHARTHTHTHTHNAESSVSLQSSNLSPSAVCAVRQQAPVRVMQIAFRQVSPMPLLTLPGALQDSACACCASHWMPPLGGARTALTTFMTSDKDYVD